jgi:lipid A 4'-phosphatase
MALPKQRVQGLIVISGLFMLGIAGTILLNATGKDFSWMVAYYDWGGIHEGWIHARDPLWALLYDYGEIPGIVLAVLALAGYVATRWGNAPKRYGKPFLVIVLTVILGPGLLVNGLLKNCWGRPRPHDVAAFGGYQSYMTVSRPLGPGGGKSFPCGHCSMGYSFASGAVFFPYHPVLGIGCLVGGIAFGTLLGMARMAQGGHFPTDVLWSGILVLMLIAGLYYLVFRIPEHAETRQKLH